MKKTTLRMFRVARKTSLFLPLFAATVALAPLASLHAEEGYLFLRKHGGYQFKVVGENFERAVPFRLKKGYPGRAYFQEPDLLILESSGRRDALLLSVYNLKTRAVKTILSPPQLNYNNYIFMLFHAATGTAVMKHLKSYKGEQLYRQGPRGRKIWFERFRKFRRNVSVQHMAPDGAYVFVHHSNKRYRGKHRPRDMRYFIPYKKWRSDVLYYRAKWKSRLRKVKTALGFYEVRLTNRGRNIVYFTPKGLDLKRKRKSYFLESYDIQSRKLKRLGVIEQPTEYRNYGKTFRNVAYPVLRTFRNSPYVMVSPEYKKRDKKPTLFHAYNIQTGRRYEYRLPSGYRVVPGFPQANHLSKPDTDSSYDANWPYLLLMKRSARDQTTRVIKVLRLPDFKIVREFRIQGAFKCATFIPGKPGF